MARRGEYLDAKVYVGGIPDDVRSDEIEDVFRRYGRIRKVWVARRPPGFAFVEYEDSRDAEDAVRALDGNRVWGVKVKVELSHGKSRNGGGSGGGRSDGRGGDRDRRSRSPRYREPRKSSPGRSRTRSPRKTSPKRSFSRSRSATPQ